MKGSATQGLVSIVLTTLNGARYLREAMDSCLNQTYLNIELIVVDGGSTDGTIEIVESYDDPRVRLIHQVGNEGRLPGAINLGLDHARGEYLTWMQDDSLYHPTAIEKMVERLKAHPEAGQVYADFFEIDADGETLSIHRLVEPDQIATAKGDPLGVCFLIRRSVRETVGPHDVETYPVQDYDYRLRVEKLYRSVHFSEALYSWRRHEGSLTGRLGWPTLARKCVEIRRKHGLVSPHEERLDLAGVDIAEAFECYRAGRYSRVPGLVLSGVKLDPCYLANRGVLSIMLRSLVAVLRNLWR